MHMMISLYGLCVLKHRKCCAKHVAGGHITFDPDGIEANARRIPLTLSVITYL
jgi:hypothetical protein